MFARIAAVFVSDHTLAACSDDGADVGESPGSGSGSGFGWARDRPPAWPVRISAAAQRTPQSSLPWTVTESQRMLCKGFNFQKGFAGAGLLEQGLAFVSYQLQLADFLAVQQRLASERLEEDTLPFGGFLLCAARRTGLRRLARAKPAGRLRLHVG